ncbi:MAG: hypothetical protein JNL58_01320 [Planctomyces sp.]|nr:hypothetical protein [Planctomyces sp.]
MKREWATAKHTTGSRGPLNADVEAEVASLSGTLKKSGIAAKFGCKAICIAGEPYVCIRRVVIPARSVRIASQTAGLGKPATYERASI